MNALILLIVGQVILDPLSVGPTRILEIVEVDGEPNPGGYLSACYTSMTVYCAIQLRNHGDPSSPHSSPSWCRIRNVISRPQNKQGAK